MILDPGVLASCQDLPDSAFYIPANRILYRALKDFHRDNRPVDFILLKQYLEARTLGKATLLEEVGGKEGLLEIFNYVPTHKNWEWYRRLVLEYNTRRKTILDCRQLEDKMFDLRIDLRELTGFKISV